MYGALINPHVSADGANNLVVELIMEDVSSMQTLRDITKNLGYAYAIACNNLVKVGMIYDPDANTISTVDGAIIYPPKSAEEEIDNLNKQIAELTYNVDTSKLSLTDLKSYLISKYKRNLDEYWNQHPLSMNDKLYTVTLEKQNQLVGMLYAYSIAKNLGIESQFPLSWNETNGTCTSYTFDELVGILFAMFNYVKPIVSLQQHNEVMIRNATTSEEALAVDISNFDITTESEVTSNENT